jgi:hypothetical protein
VSPIEGDLQRRNLLLLDSDQGLLFSDQRILPGDGCCQFLSAAIQSVGNREWKDILGAAAKLAPSMIEHDFGGGHAEKSQR